MTYTWACERVASATDPIDVTAEGTGLMRNIMETTGNMRQGTIHSGVVKPTSAAAEAVYTTRRPNSQPMMCANG